MAGPTGLEPARTGFFVLYSRYHLARSPSARGTIEVGPYHTPLRNSVNVKLDISLRSGIDHSAKFLSAFFDFSPACISILASSAGLRIWIRASTPSDRSVSGSNRTVKGINFLLSFLMSIQKHLIEYKRCQRIF